MSEPEEEPMLMYTALAENPNKQKIKTVKAPKYAPIL